MNNNNIIMNPAGRVVALHSGIHAGFNSCAKRNSCTEGAIHVGYADNSSSPPVSLTQQQPLYYYEVDVTRAKERIHER